MISHYIQVSSKSKMYSNTRHNIGFSILDLFAMRHGCTFNAPPRHQCLLATIDKPHLRANQNPSLSLNSREKNEEKGEKKLEKKGLEGSGILLTKPQTMMNLSGMAVRALADSQIKVAASQHPNLSHQEIQRLVYQSIVVIADNMDIPLGSMKLVTSGGAGGQKGLEDILNHVGKSSPIIRMKIGIGRPPAGADVADYVLGRFSRSEEKILAGVMERACDCLEAIERDGVLKAMNIYNRNV